jgi:chromate transporter
MSESPDAVPAPTPTLWSLFSSFMIVSVFGFGGTLAWARRMTVDERKWMTATEFNEVFALCQFLPGPNVMNFAVAFGSRVRGVPGAFVAPIGLCLPSLILMLILGAAYARYGDMPELQRVLHGVVCAAAGLTLGTLGRMAKPLFESKQWVSVVLMVAVLVSVGFFKLPLWWALGIFIPIGVILGWRRPV